MSALNQTYILHGQSQWKMLVAFIKANVTGRLLGVTIFDADEKNRSNSQNRFYWKARMEYLQDNAWVDGKQFSKEAWHEYLAEKYCPRKELTLPDGEIISVRTSTSDMKVAEFSTYIMQIEAYAASTLGLDFE